MGIKSDADILQGLAAHKAERAGDSETDSPITGVGETLPDDEEGSDTDDDEPADGEDEPGSEDEGSEDEPGEEAEESDDDEEPNDEPAADDEPDDGVGDKEIARIQEAEKESKQRINEKLEELKAKEAEGVDRLAKAEAIEAANAKLSKRIRRAPIALAKSLGLETHQDFLDLGQKLYKYGKALAPDAKPELKQWANGVERDGEQDSSVEDLRAEVKALTETRDSEKKQEDEAAEAEKQQAETTTALNNFADGVITECSGQFPIAAKVIAGCEGDEARNGIIEIALRLSDGKTPPTAKQIFEDIEKQERSRLKRLGLDPDEMFPRTKDKPGTASKKKKAPVKKKSSKKKPRVRSDEEIEADLKARREERKKSA